MAAPSSRAYPEHGFISENSLSYTVKTRCCTCLEICKSLIFMHSYIVSLLCLSEVRLVLYKTSQKPYTSSHPPQPMRRRIALVLTQPGASSHLCNVCLSFSTQSEPSSHPGHICLSFSTNEKKDYSYTHPTGSQLPLLLHQ